MSPTREGPVVTVDGPVGSGKSTTAREVAHRLGLRHLDSGALYRALTFALLERGIPESRWPDLDVEQLRELGVTLVATDTAFEVRVGPRTLSSELRTPEVTGRVAGLARIPAARATLLDLQREAGARGRLVADGRDMGTVVFPDADVKVFLSADLDERARRRLREGGGGEPSRESVAEQARAIAARDGVDSAREVSPLRVPDGATVIDTTGLSFEAQVERVADLVRRLTTP